MLDSLVEITGAERACIMLREPAPAGSSFSIGRNLDATGVADDPTISRNIVGTVFRDWEAADAGRRRG